MRVAIPIKIFSFLILTVLGSQVQSTAAKLKEFINAARLDL